MLPFLPFPSSGTQRGRERGECNTGEAGQVRRERVRKCARGGEEEGRERERKGSWRLDFKGEGKRIEARGRRRI